MIVVGCASDLGRVRQNNEDACMTLAPPAIACGLDSVLVVADGMGGHQAGEVASRVAVDELHAWYSNPDKTLDEFGQIDWQRDLRRALGQANRAVLSAARGDARRHGMGTTMVVGLIAGDRLFVGNVGDSRAYLVDDGEIYQLSHDHSWVAEQVRAGLLTPGAASHHPQRNVLTRALGATDEVDPDFGTFELISGEYLLLCTDGLYNVVHDHELARFVQDFREPPLIAARLVELANQRGAPDNVTVVVARFVADQD